MTKDHVSELDTLAESLRASAENIAANASVLSLGVIWHNNFDLIGATAPLRFDASGRVAVSRLSPVFTLQDDKAPAPLQDQHISRSPLMIERLSENEFSFTPPNSAMAVYINGREIRERTTARFDALGEEIILTLANSAVLCIFNAPARQTSGAEDYGLTGVSKTIANIREAIRCVANVNVPALIRGETGTGKELVAQAIHRMSDRAGRPLLAVNMATLSSALAAAELFGVKRGAFTGATQDKKGLFEQAGGGFLFLDEIGDTPRDVQPMLLRALETGEIRRVGDDKMRKVDVRIVAATDRSLEWQEGEPSFNQPLLRRLESFTIDLPPLRLRRVDIGILIKAFLRDGFGNDPQSPRHALSTDSVCKMALHGWPGNVRELRNMVQRIMLGQPVAFERLHDAAPIDHGEKSLRPNPAKPQYRVSSSVSDDELITALDESDWVIKDAAKKLNISRTALYDLMEKSTKIRKIEDISDDELRNAVKLDPSSVAVWARHLRVGREALRKKIRSLPDFAMVIDQQRNKSSDPPSK